jgi:hypothetical protein
MTHLRAERLAAPWLLILGCAVGSGAVPPDGAPSPPSSEPPADGRGPAPSTAPGGALLDAAATSMDAPAGADAAQGVDARAAEDAGDAARADAAPLGPGGLLYHFPFDGDLREASGHGDDGTGDAVQFVADRAGVPGRAARFDGATSWMSASGARLPLGASERTVTAWVRPASSPPPGLYANALVSWGRGDCLAQMWGLADVSDAVRVWTGCNDQQTRAPLPRDTWTFVAQRFTAPTTVRVWSGASSVDVTLEVAPGTSASLLWIGAETTTNDRADLRRHFAGDVDSVRIYGRALGDAEVLAVSALP